MAHAGARLPAMVTRRLCIVTPPKPVASLHRKDAHEGDAGRLANAAHRHMVQL
jgi:hypothetical protein